MDTKLTASALVLLFTAGVAYGNGSPPSDAGFSFDIPAGTVCDFPVNLTVTGKSSAISLPGDRLIITAPQQHVTVTNLDNPSNSVSFVATSTLHVSTNSLGETVVVANGRSLLADPVANILVFAVGRFSWRMDPSSFALVGLAGNGQMTDVCDIID